MRSIHCVHAAHDVVVCLCLNRVGPGLAFLTSSPNSSRSSGERSDGDGSTTLGLAKHRTDHRSTRVSRSNVPLFSRRLDHVPSLSRLLPQNSIFLFTLHQDLYLWPFKKKKDLYLCNKVIIFWLVHAQMHLFGWADFGRDPITTLTDHLNLWLVGLCANAFY